MDKNITQCPGCGHRALEWNERTKTGWCLLCGFYKFYQSYQEFIDGDEGPEAVKV